MALRDIVMDTNPQLRKVSRPVTAFDAKLAKLLDDMRQTMHAADGCGLAAPQVGILRRLAVVEADDVYLELINPTFVETSGEQIGPEACLSVKDRSCDVKRPYRITIAYQNRDGKPMRKTLEGFVARACCHEMDHLDGVLFYDKEYRKR